MKKKAHNSSNPLDNVIGSGRYGPMFAFSYRIPIISTFFNIWACLSKISKDLRKIQILGEEIEDLGHEPRHFDELSAGRIRLHRQRAGQLYFDKE